MIMCSELELLLRLVVAVILGGIIGLERGGTKHAAGLRTHTILCLGAASVMVVSESLVERFNIPGEIMRMGAQIISGVGFLGAGSIIMNGGQLHGITTAAGLWTTACVGIAIGSGNYLVAVFMVILIMSVMLGLRSISLKIRTEPMLYSLVLELENIAQASEIINEILSNGLELKSTKLYNQEDIVIMEIDIILTQNITKEVLVANIANKGHLREFSKR